MRTRYLAFLCMGCGGGSPEAAPSNLGSQIDDRPVVTSSAPPPPISGGTLLVTQSGEAVVADADRDRLTFVEPVAGAEPLHVALRRGDEPGRLAEDGAGRVHVVLRGSGEVASLDLGTHAVVGRRSVCTAPRGIAYDRHLDAVHVACADGTLATLPANPKPESDAPLTAARFRTLGADLRDVAVVGERVYVSRFRSAEIMEVDRDGQVVQTKTPSTLTASIPGAAPRRMNPTVAWRMLALQTGEDDGQVVVLHQRSSQDEVGPRELSSETNDTAAASPTAYYGSAAASPVQRCDGASHAAFSEFAAGAQDSLTAERGTQAFGNLALAVDIAVSDTGEVAIVNAGATEPDAALRDNTAFPGAGQRFVPSAEGLITSVAVTSRSAATDTNYGSLGSCAQYKSVALTGQYTSAAYTKDALLLQRREPAGLVVLKDGVEQFAIELEGESVRDTGHDIFHRDPGGGIACASCHPEGQEDGHVWDFAEFEPRRTQALNLGLADTAPYHWAGDVDDMAALVDEVMVSRMGSTYQSKERTDALSSWLFSLPAPEPSLSADVAGVEHGRDLFNDESVGCAGCHSGPRFTDNSSRDVGTGETVQVPSLLGLSRRAPYMRTGCATTLEARFTAECGGAAHGNVNALSDIDRADLLAFLNSL